MLRSRLSLACGVWLALTSHWVYGHDTWLEAGPLQQAVGEYTYVNLMLGNHGNEHRDFKLASKITLAPCTLSAISPDGRQLDLKPLVRDMGNADKEGYWTARYQLESPGIHELVHTLDTLHGTIRAIKSAKTFVVAQPADAEPTQLNGNSERMHGHGLELVLRSPLAQLASQQELTLQVLRSGKPLAGARVSFVPRGVQLQADFDETYERTSDATGLVQFTPHEGNVVLAIVHHLAPDENGEGYERTHYSATLVLPVRNQLYKLQ